MKIGWTRRALAHLNSAHDYIAEARPSSAEQLLQRIEVALQALRHHPEIGRVGRIPGTREFAVAGTPFLIAYRIRVKRIEILALLHGARRWPDEF